MPATAPDLTDRDLDRLADLIEQWASGVVEVVDARTVSRALRRHALHWSLLETRADGRLAFTRGSAYSLTHSTPPAVLWRLFVRHCWRPVDGSQGYGIVREAGWLRLNIRPQGHRLHNASDLREMEDVLAVLHQAGYLDWLACGSVWEIRALDRPTYN